MLGPETMAEYEPDHSYKVILIGNSAVGKTSMMKRIMDFSGTDFFQSSHKVTIGVDHGQVGFKIADKCMVKLQIFDTAG